MPKNIGRGAELVLRGCLEASTTQRWTIAAVDDVSWSVGWDSDTDDLMCSGHAESELERIIHETRARAQGPASRSRSHVPCDDAMPELEDDAELPRRSFARSTSSRSRSTGTGPFSPFTNAWSEIEMPSVGPPELALPGTLPRPSLELTRGRHAIKDGFGGRRSSLGPARSSSPSVAPISPSSAEMRGRKGIIGRPGVLPLQHHTQELGHGLRPPHPKRSGSQPARHSTPWAVPSRARASVGVSPALSVALSTPHADGGFVLRTGVAHVRSRSVERA